MKESREAEALSGVENPATPGDEGQSSGYSAAGRAPAASPASPPCFLGIDHASWELFCWPIGADSGGGGGSVEICVWLEAFGESRVFDRGEMIPFLSISEAAGALRRDLTSWEGWWWNQTHNVSDFTLYCFNIVFLFIIFSVAPLPYVLLDVWKVRSAEKYKVQPGVHNEPAGTWRCYKVVLWSFFTVVGPLQLCSFPAVKFINIRFGLPLPTLTEVFLQLAIYTIVEDYGNYWLHRYMHQGWWYDNVHCVHHEFQTPTSYAAPYAHWAEIVILGIPTFVGPAIAPGHIITFWAWIAIRQLEALETHSGYDFPWNPTRFIPFYGGSEYHDYHHFVGGKSQSNFASVFTYCDTVYGTNKGYRYMKDVHKKEAIAKGKEQQMRENGWLQTDDLKAISASLSRDVKAS